MSNSNSNTGANKDESTEPHEENITQETLTDEEKTEWRELHEKPTENLSDAEKTSKIKLSLKRRYDAPEWAVAFELASPDQRRADAIAVNTFPSRNFKVIGFEFKASRSDWLAEKREGAKSDYFVNACDEWYVVAWSNIVNEDELPDGWGLLELKPNSEQLWSQVESNLTAHQEGEPDRAFWGRFIQKTIGSESNYTEQDLTEARKRGYEEGWEERKERETVRADSDVQRKAEKWEELETAGLDGLYSLSDREIRELKDARKLLRMLDADGYKSLRSEFDRLVNAVNEFRAPLNRLERAVDETELDVNADETDDDADDTMDTRIE